MIKGLVGAIVNAYNGPDALYLQMEELGIDSTSSALALVTASCVGSENPEDIDELGSFTYQHGEQGAAGQPPARSDLKSEHR